jgi:hypothetical protein
MKLWLLRPMKGDPAWEPWYDKCFGFVVRAETEHDARKLANSEAGDENHDKWSSDFKPDNVWLDPKRATCVVLNDSGPEAIIIRDFASA